jgi:hypothetical protein
MAPWQRGWVGTVFSLKKRLPKDRQFFDQKNVPLYGVLLKAPVLI